MKRAAKQWFRILLLWKILQIADPASPYWVLVRQAMYGMVNVPNETGYKYTSPYGIVAKSGT